MYSTRLSSCFPPLPPSARKLPRCCTCVKISPNPALSTASFRKSAIKVQENLLAGDNPRRLQQHLTHGPDVVRGPVLLGRHDG
ncbi:hypothetical protein E2C01_084767 [Portunus trituberculatus]|uniref:Uncharacterized protein n=1 Tax=Portunus trituberculatus TaxID=210409 RepID=A0A5B7J8L9_PORTR|nr:hypothetical protein [Portunus trituberculatus]